MRTLLALAGAFLLVIAGIGTLAAFSDPADEARMTAAEVRIACLEAGEPCPPATTTPEPTATNVPPTATEHEHENVGVCGESNLAWHAPEVDGCATGHEHGAAPPAFVLNSQWQPMHTHPANTPNENVLPHKMTAFKGFVFSDDGVQVYMLVHLDTNPGGHASRFHSYQAWALDAAGNVSHWIGWMDFGQGQNTGPNLRRIHCDDTSIRPVMAVNDEGCGVLQFESWYGRTSVGGWSWDVGFNVRANYYTGGDPTDPNTWVATGENNRLRRIEAAWYSFRSSQRGTFWADQFGFLMSGPDDARCDTTFVFAGKTYTRFCLEQYIAPTMTTVGFPGNALQTEFPGPSQNPN